jgi:hypothetical protein
MRTFPLRHVILPIALLAIASSARALTLNPVEGTYSPSDPKAAFDQTHPRLNRVLGQYVTADAQVRYKSLKANRSDLDAYLAEVSSVKLSDFNGWSDAEQLALLINLYNAATLQLIIDHYPVESIKKIGGVFKGPWKQPVVKIFGKIITLDTLEHKVLRTQFSEPRVHFAIVCAAKGCPPLRAEAYTAAQLEAQLEDQGHRFLAETKKNSVSGNTIYLSPIFKWFEEDFTRKKKYVTSFVRDYFPEETAAKIGSGFPVKYTDYDWSLNSAE